MLLHINLLFYFADDKGIYTFSIRETLYESIIMKECMFDSEVSVENSNDQSVKHLDNLSGKYN